MNIPLPKLKAILLYFGTNTDPRFLGKVKLMKLFYFLDFTHLKKFGSPVTYDTYVNLEHGPIPSTIKNLVDTAMEDVDHAVLADTITFQQLQRTDGANMYRIVPTRKFTEQDKKYFTPTELEILETVCRRFGDKNTEYIKEASHKEAPWNRTHLLETIPYTLATRDSDCLVNEEEIKTLLEISS